MPHRLPHRSDGTVLYTGICWKLTFKEQLDKAKGRSPALRIRVLDEKIAFTDGNLGLYAENLALIAAILLCAVATVFLSISLRWSWTTPAWV